ncbi:MAG: L,D-transpeptidase [Rhodothermales bacterium]
MYNTLRYHLLALVCVLLVTPYVQAQDYFNQEAMEAVLDGNRMVLDNIPEVTYEYYTWVDHSGLMNGAMARNTFYKIIGEGNGFVGKQRGKLVEMINRKHLQDMRLGDRIIVPRLGQYDLDFRAYSPFPKYYAGGSDFEKLFVIDKSIQAFAAYNNGELERWGVVNTGAEGSRTPNGRYNFNWKTEFRVSSLSPPGERWEMYWVFNFHEARGIHVHQYAMPTGGPRSHGCVRLIEADAKWIYNWADQWRISNSSRGYNSGRGTVVEPGTTVIVIGEDPIGAPSLFQDRNGYPEIRRSILPTSPMDLPAGTPQQKYFDRVRG